MSFAETSTVVKTEAPRAIAADAVFAVVIGNALEWYEVVIFGYFAGVIGEVFFSFQNASGSLLLAFAGFGLTYLARPVGAFVLGAYADRKGRKPALQVTILLMLAGTVAISCCPSYASIGIAAPLVVIAARLVQGFAVGGEFGAATAYLAEQSASQRGYYASWQFASQGLTALLATAVGTLVAFAFSPDELRAWAWRLPFLLGVLIYPLGLYVRLRVDETDAFLAERGRGPGAEFYLSHCWRGIVVCLGLVSCGTVAIYTIVFLPTYAVRYLALSMPDGFSAGMLTGVLNLLLVPLFGAWSDRIGRAAVPIGAACAMLFGALPAFLWLAHGPTFAKLLIFQFALGVAISAYLGALPALMSELFPVGCRTFGLSIGYSIGVAVFGGFTPLLHAYLVERSGSAIGPACYLMFAALLGLAALFASIRLPKFTGR